MSEGRVFDFRNRCVDCLKSMFGENNVKKEWDVAKGSLDALTRNLYCPRIDIAVGPFNINGKIWENMRRIDQTYVENRNIVEELNSRSINTIDERDLNRNPRCFLAIEIENTGTRKTRIGSIINASAIGKIGIIVAWTAKVLDELQKIQDYLNFLTEVGKIPDAFKNVMIVEREKFSKILERYLEMLF